MKRIIALSLVFFITAIFFTGCVEGTTNGSKADDATNYTTIETVENACRSMIASYNSDKLMYLTYSDTDIAEQEEWAQQAKIRANKTATTYNEYILKNSFVWEDNIPDDIISKLEVIE